MFELKQLNSQWSTIWNGLDGTNPHDSLVKSLQLTASQYCKRLFLLTASYQPAKNILNISIQGEEKWIFINGRLFTHWIISLSRCAMDAVYFRMMDWLLHMNKTIFLLKVFTGVFKMHVWVLHTRQNNFTFQFLNLTKSDLSARPSVLCSRKKVQENCLVELETRFFVYIAAKTQT